MEERPGQKSVVIVGDRDMQKNMAAKKLIFETPTDAPDLKMNRKELRRQKFGRGQAQTNKQNPEKDRLIWDARSTLKVINEWEYEYEEKTEDGSMSKVTVLLPEMPKSVTIHASQELTLGTQQRFKDTDMQVVQTDTLSALNGLDNPCALVFASGKKPGGGWLTGAKAQEEDICRCSALWEALKDSPMYAENKRHLPGLYSDTMIYCPQVPIFKDAKGFLPVPKVASFVASPAVNLGVTSSSLVSSQIEQIMITRMTKILCVMHHYGHAEIVLGSYGCGVFKNDITNVAKWFVDLLQGPFKGCFKKVLFACIDPKHAEIFDDLLFDPHFDGSDLSQQK